ncbi:MAG TPA: hypothetical protein VFV34_11290 [Blastocatellia bacterium]|nr:hypothetical protein [Blastocatellia bacterium]
MADAPIRAWGGVQGVQKVGVDFKGPTRTRSITSGLSITNDPAVPNITEIVITVEGVTQTIPITGEWEVLFRP